MFFPDGLWLGFPVVIGYCISQYPVWVIKFKDREDRREMKRSVREVIKNRTTTQTTPR